MASDTVVEEFNRILNKNSIDDTKVVIDGLRSKQGNDNFRNLNRRFTEIAKGLPNVTVTKKNQLEYELTNGSETDILKKIGGGTYGTIFLGNSGNVYKRIYLSGINGYEDLEVQHERFHRELFIEAFIQCVLQCDETYGKNIAKLQGIYKDKIVEDTASFSATLQVHLYYYKMENIPFTLSKYIGTLTTNYNLIERMSANFQTLGEMLLHFINKYHFVHRDLHSGNIMFTDTGEIKLIDFGSSETDNFKWPQHPSMPSTHDGHIAGIWLLDVYMALESFYNAAETADKNTLRNLAIQIFGADLTATMDDNEFDIFQNINLLKDLPITRIELVKLIASTLEQSKQGP
jgi:serine/threonine protein kinase